MHQKWGPTLDNSAGAHIDPWPSLGIIPADLDIYFEVSALLEGEQNFILPSADSEQAVIPKTLEHDLKPNGDVEPEQYDAVQRPARLKLPEPDPDKAGGVWLENTLAMLTCPQLAVVVETGNVEAPTNPCMVEAM